MSSYLTLNALTRSFVIMISLIFVGGMGCRAQFRNVKVDEQNELTGSACDPSIAINPKNTLNMVAASALNNVYTTQDGGLTWSKQRLSSSLGVHGDPALIADSRGRFYVFHLSDPVHGAVGYEPGKLDRIVVQASGDDGKSWNDGESIGFNPPKDQGKARPTVDSKGNLYVTWTQFDKYGDKDPNCLSTILFSKSRNGAKWSEPIQISQTPGNCEDDDNTAEGAVPAVSREGKIYVSWSNQQKIFFDRSFDGGSTWLMNDLVIAQQPGGWNLKIPGHDRCNGMPVTMVNNSKTTSAGHLYVVWADQRNGENDTDIWFIRSANYGDNWTSPLKINKDRPGKHQYLPWMAIDDVSGFIYIVYYDRRNHDDNRTDVYLAFSTDGGSNFKEVKINETPFSPTEENFFGDYLDIDAHDGTIRPIWTRMDDGKTSVWTCIIDHKELINIESTK